MNITAEGKKEFDVIIKEVLSSTLFNFMRVLEEDDNFKIIYEENGKQVNLVDISEMLKAEPMGKEGWINRFSKKMKDCD